MRISLPDSALSGQAVAAIPAGYSPSKLLGGREGFSAANAILFELDAAPDPATLPADGGGHSLDLSDLAVGVFDFDRGERVPIRVEESAYAASSLVGKPSHVIRIFPRARLSFDRHYVAVVTDRVQRLARVPDSSGTSFTTAYTAPAALRNAAGADKEAVRYHEPIVAFLGRLGVSAGRVLNVTEFRTRTEEDATGSFFEAVKKAYDADHPIRALRTTSPTLYPQIRALVEGEIALTDFRVPGASIDFDAHPSGVVNWVPFVLAIPNSAGTSPSAVAIYGHGLTADRNTMSILASTNAEHGFATIAIDHPNHGARSTPDGGGVLSLRSPAAVPTLVGMLAQSPIDQVSLLKAVRTSFASIDVVGRNGAQSDGRPDLDTSRVVYEATSLGGVLGSAFVAAADVAKLDLLGSYLQVSGAGFVNTLLHSKFWDGIFSAIVPKEASGAESELLLAAVGHRIDRADAINAAHHIVAPLFLTYGVGDQIVCNSSSLALAEVARLPLLNPVIDAPQAIGLDYVGASYPPNRTLLKRGVLQAQIKRTGITPLDVETHLSFLLPEAREAHGLWLDAIAVP